MGMANGAFEGDKERARQAAEAARIAMAAQKQQFDQQMAVQKAETEAQHYADTQAQQQYQNEQAEKKYADQMAQQKFSNDFAMQKYADERADKMAERLLRQQKIYNEYDALGKQSRQRVRQQREDAQTAAGSLLKSVYGQSDGVVSRDCLNAFNRQLGLDGNTAGFTGGFMTRNGDFILDYAQMGPDGQVRNSRQVIGLPDQAIMMSQLPGVFNGDDLIAHGELMKKRGYRDSEIAAVLPGLENARNTILQRENEMKIKEMNALAKAQKDADDLAIRKFDTEQRWAAEDSKRYYNNLNNAMKAIDGQLKTFEDPLTASMIYGSPESAEKAKTALFQQRKTLLDNMINMNDTDKLQNDANGEVSGISGISGNPKQDKSGEIVEQAVGIGRKKEVGETFEVGGQTFKVVERNGKTGIVRVGAGPEEEEEPPEEEEHPEGEGMPEPPMPTE